MSQAEQERERSLSTADMVAAGQSRNEPPSSTRAPGGEPMPNGGTSGGGAPVATAPRAATPPSPNGGAKPATSAPLLPADQADPYRKRWDGIQTGFVDEPRKAVEEADHLVAEVIKRVAEIFAEERGKLETQWSRGDEVDTEDLRVALQRYRSFFERLLSA